MKNKKLILSIMVCASIVSIVPNTTFAYSTATTSNSENTYIENYVRVYGTVGQKSDSNILLTNSSNISDEISLNISKDTIIIDYNTGLPVSLKDINLNDKISVFLGQAMTASLPPIANAQAIIINAPSDAVSPNYIQVESVKNNNDGSITVISNDGKYEATLDKDTTISPYLTKNIVNISDVTVGSNLLLWEDPNAIQTKDIPKKVHITKCVLFPQENNIEDNLVDSTLDNDKNTGWVQNNGKWYYFNNQGVMETNWIKDNEKWYFLDEDGSMKTGWVLVNGVYYYLKTNGEMAHDEYIDGYYLNSNGAWEA